MRHRGNSKAVLLVCFVIIGSACGKETSHAESVPTKPPAEEPLQKPQAKTGESPAGPEKVGESDPSPTLPIWVQALQRSAGIADPNDPWNCLSAAQRVRDFARCSDLARMAQDGVDPRQTNDAAKIVREAAPVLQRIWAETFRRAKLTFDPPSIDYYGLSTDSPIKRCELPLENAVYCSNNNAIYYDAVFLAKVGKSVAQQTQTSGRYAVVSVVAHEMGHAASYQMGASKQRASYVDELVADCFSGATIKALSDVEAGGSKSVQLLHEITPLAEGQMGLYLMSLDSLKDGVHPEGDIRSAAYTAGFKQGVLACAPESFR